MEFETFDPAALALLEAGVTTGDDEGIEGEVLASGQWGTAVTVKYTIVGGEKSAGDPALLPLLVLVVV